MITLTGRDILAKYLIGQIDSYASHIAIGCGALPVLQTTTPVNYGSKTELDFEMARYPIISRSISTESIVFTATQVQALGDQFIFTFSSHSFKIGQTVKVSGQAPQFNNSGDPDTNSNGTYVIVDISSTTITVNSNYVTGSTVGQTLTGQNISVSGYVPQIVFVAELPVTERYEITEFGIYPSGSNQYSNGSDSRIVCNFTTSEDWQYFNGTNLTDILSYSLFSNLSNDISISDKAFQTNSNNSFFITDRVARQERPRFLKNAIIISGDISNFTGATAVTGNYIQLSNFNLDLSKNSSVDEIKIAYSLINKLSTPSQIPKSLNIMLQFITNDGNSAKYHYRVLDSTTIVSATNRYKVLSLPIGKGGTVSSTGTLSSPSGTGTYTGTITNMSSTSNITVGDILSSTTGTGNFGTGTMTVTSVTSSSSIAISSTATFTAGNISNITNNYVSQTSGFNWQNVNSLKIYAGIETAITYAGTAVTDYSIALDSIRFENKSNTNPLYGLVGYTVVNTNAIPLIKDSGTNNMVEFKFVVGVSNNV